MPIPPPADLFIVFGELEHCNCIHAETTLRVCIDPQHDGAVAIITVGYV